MVVDLTLIRGPILVHNTDHCRRFVSDGVLSRLKFGPIRKNFIWIVGNYVIGTITLTRTTENECWLTNVYIHPDYRGYGISKTLLEFAVRTHGANLLTVLPDNKKAINLYLKYGFKHKGYDKNGSIIMARDGWVASNISRDKYDTKSPKLIW